MHKYVIITSDNLHILQSVRYRFKSINLMFKYEKGSVRNSSSRYIKIHQGRSEKVLRPGGPAFFSSCSFPMPSNIRILKWRKGIINCHIIHALLLSPDKSLAFLVQVLFKMGLHLLFLFYVCVVIRRCWFLIGYYYFTVSYSQL